VIAVQCLCVCARVSIGGYSGSPLYPAGIHPELLCAPALSPDDSPGLAPVPSSSTTLSSSGWVKGKADADAGLLPPAVEHSLKSELQVCHLY